MGIFSNFLESSSIGGFSHISTSSSQVGKLFWTVVVLTSIAVTCFFTGEAMVNWSKYPIATTTESFPILGVQFPKITVCPPKVAFSFNFLIQLESNLHNFDNCQAQFQFSPVPVKLRLALSLIITHPPNPTHPPGKA